MKSKKILTLSSIFLAATLFSSCASTTNVVTFNDYWQNNPDANLTQFTETLEYSVKYEPEQGITDGYALSYSDGAYTTTLTLLTEGGKSYYRYETAFSIKAIFNYGNETRTFDDSITSWVTFEKSANNLQPISSHKELVCHSPANTTQPTNIEDCYINVNYTIDTTYESDLSSGKTVIVNRDSETDASLESTFDIDNEKTRYVDNEQLYLAMRAINSSSTTSASLLVYAPFTVAVQTVKATFASAEGETLTFKRNGVDVNEAIEWNTATLAIDSKNPGASQTLWIAKRQEGSKLRNVIFKMQLPLSYAMGNLVYTLTSETYTEA